MTTIAANRDQSIRIEDMFKNSTSFNDEEFLRAFRMNREQARNLVLLLQETSHFKDIGTKERPLLFQLLVFLYRVGQKGKAGSDSKVNQFFKIGKGTVRRYVRNVMRSLLELKDQFLCWPEREERAEISSRILVEFGFPNCVGIMDGTLVFLDEAPVQDTIAYFSRKTRYALSLLVVCDDRKRITYIYGPWPGSTHDNRIWRNSKLCVKKDEFFSEREYLLGDSAFSISPVVVQSFKKTPGQASLCNEEEFFNTKLGSPRVRSEHCIGILKNRFPCLKTINIRIKGRDQLKEFMDLVEACSVLHNILIKDDDIPQEWIDTIEEQTDWSMADDAVDADENVVSRRDAIFHYVIECYYNG